MEKKDEEKDSFNFEEFEKNFDFSSIKFNFRMADTNYQLDALQNQMLQLYLMSDKRFRRAFNTNYTSQIITYMKDKARLNEPIKISTMGATRSGKSYSMITLCILHQAFYKKLFHPFYICANVYEYIEKLQRTPKERLVNRIFLVDEEKQAVYGVGSVARKMKVSDVQNIIALNNISTIMLTPFQWQDKSADYGVRAFGRCFNTKTNRLMLYNLQERGGGGSLPLGNIYLPIFTELMKNDYGQWLEKKYLERKNTWIDMERRGEGDVLEGLKKKTAMSFAHDKKFLELKHKKDRTTYISVKLGSEWTRTEIEQIENIAKLIQQGYIEREDLEKE